MKSSFHSLISFYHYSAAANSEDSTQFNSSAPKLVSRQAGVSKLDSSLLDYSTRSRLLTVSFYNHSARTTQKTISLLVRRFVYWFHAYASREYVYRVVA
jgi:uncharacterized membrane-anchored protein